MTIDNDAAGTSRDEFLAQMQEAGIGVGVHYQCLASHPYYQQRFGWRAEDYPVAFAFGETTVSLPLSSKLTDDEVAYIIDITRSLVGGRGR